jgi:hypothetical protein
MPSDKSLFLQKIDQLSLAETGKTAEQGRLDLIREKQNIQAISEYQDSLYGTPKISIADSLTDNISDILEKNYLVTNQEGLLSNPNNRKAAIETVNLSGTTGGSGLLMGTQDRSFKTINLDKISLDPETKSSFGNVANILSSKLESGDLKALDELKSYFQKAYNSGSLSDEAKEKLQKEYTDLSQHYKNKNVYNSAAQNFNTLLENTDKNQKQNFINQLNQDNSNSNAYNFAYNIGIDPNDTASKQKLLTDMLDAESYVPGSFVYNTENLNAVKNSPLSISPIFSSGTFGALTFGISKSIGTKLAEQSQKEYVTELANINYNYTNLMGVAAKNKEQELEQSLIVVNDQLKKDPNNQNILAQKKQVEENLLFSREVAKKLEPLQDKKNFYKLSYPDLYREEVKKEKSEILYNDLVTASWYEHPFRKTLGNAKNILYRGGQQMVSNTANQISGIAALTGDKVGAFGFNLGAKSFAPPQYRRVNDFNKNSLIEANEVIKDAEGNPIYVSNVHWVDEKGKGHWNLAAATEQTLPIAIDVAQTILLSRGVGAVGRGLNTSWANIGKSAGLSKTAQKTFLKEVAPRISTFGNTFATTFPRFYAEERNNFKDDGDARNVALMRSGVEALSETIVPDTDFFKANRNLGPLDNLLKKAGKLDPTNFTKMTYNRDVLLGLLPKNTISSAKAALLVAPSTIRRTLSGAFQEAIEEEFSLLGNYFVDKYAASQDFTIEQTNDLTLQNGLETFVSGFIPSLFISGVPAAFDSRSRRSQARWDIANNPEQYVAFINKQVQDGKLTKEEAVKRTSAVNGLKTRLDSITDINSLKDISTLLDDRDQQFNYFNSIEDIEDLLSMDTSTFTPEQITAYEKQLSDANGVVMDSKKRIEKYVELTEQEKKDIISNMFSKQAKTAANPENNLTTLLNTLNQTTVNRAQVSKEDEREDFISGEYDKFLLDVESTIADRLDGFQQLLEESPEKLTLLELELAKTNFIPFLQQYKGSKRQEPVNAPFLPTTGPQLKNFYEEDLIDLIDGELKQRKLLNKDQSISEGSANLTNPETKDAQVAIMTAAELSEAELQSGELAADAHTHLTDAQRLVLGNILERHIAQKEAEPNKQTQLEAYRKYANNFYELSTRGLTPEESLVVIKDMNKSILEKANIKSVTDEQIKEELSKTEETEKTETSETSKTSEIPKEKEPETPQEEKPFERGFTPASSKEPKEDKTIVVSERPINQEVYDSFRNERVNTEEGLEEQLIGLESEEDKKTTRATFNSGIREDFFNYLIGQDEISSLEEAEAAMLGYFIGEEQAITKFFDSLYSNEPDFSIEATSFLPIHMLEDFETRMMGLKNNLTPVEQEKADNQEEEGETIPEVKLTEIEIQENNVNNKNELNQQEDNKVEAVNKNTLQLNIVELDRQDRLTENPFNLRALNIVQIVDNKIRGGANADIAILIQLPLNTLKTVLSAENFAKIESFINAKKPLSVEEKQELENIFTINGIKIADQDFINFFAKNPTSINNPGAALTVITNKEGEVMYFTPEGYIGTPETGAPLITALKSGPAKNQVTEITNTNTPVLATVTGTEGTAVTKSIPLVGLVNDKSKIYVHLGDTVTRVSPFGNTYTVEKGGTYLEREGAIYPYERIDTPQVDGNNLFNLIEAFNNGTLPEGFPTDPEAFLELIGDNFFSDRKNKTLRYFHQGQFFIAKNRDNDKLNIKGVTPEGKAKIIGKSTQKELLSKTQIRKPLFANKFNTEQPFKAVLFVNGQPTIKDFKTYREFVLSSDFGATVKRDWQKTLKAEQPLPMVPTQPETFTQVQDVEENIVDPLEQPTPISDIESKKADIERRRLEEFEKLFTFEERLGNYILADGINTILVTKNAVGGWIAGIKIPKTNEQGIIIKDTVGQLIEYRYQDKFENFGKGEEAKLKAIRYGLDLVDNKINAKYDAEYVDAVKKGTMTKEQAMKALEEVGRKDSSAYAELAALEQPVTDTISDIEAKKADIEKKRQEEIDSYKDVSSVLKNNIESIINNNANVSIKESNRGIKIFIKTEKGKNIFTATFNNIGNGIYEPGIIETDVDYRGKGIASKVYEIVNNYLESKQSGKIKTNERNFVATEKTGGVKLAGKMWDSMTRKGIAKKTGSNYEMLNTINVKYDAELTALGQPIQKNTSVLDVETKKTEDLKVFAISPIKTDYYNVPIFLDSNAKVRGDKQEYISREAFDKAYANDNREGAGFQTAETLLRRGGYTKGELFSGPKALLKPEIDKIDAKYDIEQPVNIPAVEKKPAPKRRSLIERANDQIKGRGEDTDFNPESLKRARTLSNKITKQENEAAKAWVSNHPIFKNTPFIFDSTIAHPEAYAIWSKSGIQLFQGANYAEAYHEAWHEFSQLYLTSEQKEKLYSEARKVFGNLPFVELEEKIAESFRQYALTGGQIMPSEIAKYNETKNIFQKIWDFITNLISEKKTIDKYFNQLYKGNITRYKRNEQNAYFKKLYSSKLVILDENDQPLALSYTETQKTIEEFDGLFVDIANTILKPYNASVINVLLNPKQVKTVYQNVVKYLDTVYQEEFEILEQNPDDLTQAERVDHLALKIVNIAGILDFHKNNSTLFDNKIKSTNILNAIDEVLNEPENEGIGEFEKSIEEMSQKDMASDVIINAIRTLPRYEGTEKITDPVLGFALLGDFETNWTILQRELTGLNTYNEMYNKIKEVAVTFPQFNTFLSYLPNPDNTITRVTDLAFKVQFFNLFTMPYIDGSTIKIERDDRGNITETKVLKAISLDAVQLRSQLDTDFYTEAGPFRVLTTNGSYALDTEDFFSMFADVPSIPAGDPNALRGFYDQVYLQLQALGLNYTSLGLESLRAQKPEIVLEALSKIRTKLKSLSDTGSAILTPLTSLSKEHKLNEASVASEIKFVNYFLNLEIEANPTYANDMRYNAVGKQIWSVNQHTYMTKVLSVLNDSTNYKTLDDIEKEIPHLNQAMNTNARGSWVLKYLFNVAGNRIFENGKPRKVEIVNLLGIEDGFDGEKTIDSLSSMKHFADIVGLLKGGVEEINRLSGKSTTRGIGLDLSARKFLGLAQSDKGDSSEYSFMDQDKVKVDFRLFSQLILPILKSEIDTHNSDVNENLFRFKSKNVELAYFEKIIDNFELRQSLVNDLKELPANTTLEDAFKKLSYAKEVYSKFNEYLNNNIKVSQDTLAGYNLSNDQLAKYHFYSFVMRVEQHKLFFNHPYYYKDVKDIEKRLSAWNAYGDYTNMDRTTVAALNNLENDPYAQEKAFQQYAIENNLPLNVLPKDPTKLSYLVFKDNPVVSETAQSPAYDKVRDAYTKDKDSKAQDAASVATMDFFRRFYATSTGITLDMEEEFARQNNIWSTYLQLKNANQYEAAMLQRQLDSLLNQKPKFKFSVKKLQYAGNNPSIFGPSIPIFHKYSVKTLLPSEAVTNPRVADILFKLYASGADYGVFSSGTKIAETVSPIDLFKDGQVDTAPSAPGIVEIKYLKEQVIIENKESFQNIFSSQLRKLIYKDATTNAELEAYELYASYVKNLVEYDSNEFLEKLDNKEKLVEFIVGELSRKGAAQATKDLIQIKEDGKLQYLLDALVDRTVMEGAIVSSVKNKVIKQKVNGAQRVQFPVSLMSDRKLKYYDLKDGKITKAEAMISFSKLYYPLLNLEYNGRPIGELNAKGEPTNPHTALKRLNEALNDPAFRKQNERQINIVAIRIPGQGYNSIESFEIVEFLPEETGDIILVPDEMVVKSGSDYDIDKLFCYDPFIEADGSVTINNLTPKEAFARKKELASRVQNNKEIIKELLKEKQEVLAEVDEFIKSKNISNVSDVYKELKKLKSEKFEDDTEVDEEMDLKQMLLDKFNNGLSRKEILEKNLSKDEKSKLAERRSKIKNLSSILQDYSETKLSLRIQEVNETLDEIYQELTDSKNELKAIRNRFANNILFNMSDRLTNEEIFEDLITPNSISEIEKAADGLTKNPTNEANYTNIVNPNYQLYVFSLNTYKKALGTDAKNNVLHSILQKAKLTIVDKKANDRYILPANRTEGNLTFEGTRDTKGKPISLVQGQMISAHVDIEKDDRIALINFNNVVTPIVNYATMLGTPFEAMVKLVNVRPNPDQESLITKYSKLNDFQEIIKEVEKINDPAIQQILTKSIGKYGYKEETFVNLIMNDLLSKGDNKTVLQGLFKVNPISDVYRLGLFLEMKAQTDKVRRLSANTDFDTISPQNFESLRANGGELLKLKQEKFFEETAFNKVIFESVVSPFQVQTSILDKFVEIFPVSASKTVTDGIVKLYENYRKPNPFLKYETLSRIFKNDFLYSMYINEVPNVIQYETLLDKRNPNNLKVQYESLKKRLAEKNITSQNRIFDLVRFNTDEKSNFLRSGLKQNSFDYSVDFYREQFTQGFNYSHPKLDPQVDAQLLEDMQEFFNNFAYAGILGSQLNKRFDSYLPLIPEQIYTYPMSSVLENFANLSEEEQKARLSQFTVRFKQNHPELAKVKDVNPDLNFYKDYVLSRINTIPSKSNGEVITKVDEEVDTATETQSTTQPIIKGEEVKAGIFVNEGAISKEEQLELFNYLKPFLEEQAAKTNKGKYASKMIGLGLRWDYKSNNPGRTAVNIPDVISLANKLKYGYYTESINGQPLGQISDRFREIIAKATGLDMSIYDGAIINLYDNDSFISSHNDVDESRSAINYPVVGINLGGSGNFSIESRDGSPMQLNLDAGTVYVFGVNGVNREVFHRTFPTAQNTFLPELTTKLDNKTYPAGSYRVTITMRRVMPLDSNMPISPLQTIKQSTQPTQLNLFQDQPRLTAQEVADRERLERESAIDFQEGSMADEELYYEYTLDKQSFTEDLPAEAEVLQEMRPTRESFIRFADKANLQGSEGKGIILNYIAKKDDGFTVDIIAERASDIANREITPNDIVEFILRYPGGIGAVNSKSKNTYYGFNNPDNNSKYDSIRDLIKQRKKQRTQVSRTPSVTNVEDDIFGPFGDMNDFNVQVNQAAQDSFMGLRNRNKKGEDNC